jgi:cobyrinic acid a,c-diamide synthase
MVTIPRIVVAGTHSGCGKTTIATGIMAALVARGQHVQPFKVGPDFIDPSHHTLLCGRESRNLDPYMMGVDGVQQTFARASAGADIAVIEGVMGLYDGVDGTDCASTAHVARLLSAPIVLVVDAKGMSRSVHALIQGFRTYDPNLRIAGVIVNRIGSARHRAMIECGLEIPALGWLPRIDSLAIGSRHLGLRMAHERTGPDAAGAAIEEHCLLDAIFEAAAGVPPLATDDKDRIASERLPAKSRQEKFPLDIHLQEKHQLEKHQQETHWQDNHRQSEPPRARIAVALDHAFCFYYRDNLDFLQDSGAKLIFFSPMADPLPDADALYIGGGYPELHMDALERSPCTLQVKKAAGDGMPIWAECGGLMYLTRRLKGEQEYQLCGVLPADTVMTKSIQALGYTRGEGTGASNLPFAGKGMAICGHEFHYSRVIPDSDARYAFLLSRGKGIDNGNDGLIAGSVIGTYTHAYFSREFAMGFVDAAMKYRQS